MIQPSYQPYCIDTTLILRAAILISRRKHRDHDRKQERGGQNDVDPMTRVDADPGANPRRLRRRTCS
ncbi:hypothetical protein LINGRAHAP2_LOCUS5131, partial [Linum grandiflorum]